MGLRENILTEPVSELELRELIAVRPDVPVREVAEKMRRQRLGCVIVLDDAGKPVGKFTERKLMKLLLTPGASLDDAVSRHMYPSADPIPSSAPIAAAIRQMQARRLRFLCVIDEQGRAVALTGQKGLMQYVAEHFPRQVKVQTLEPKLGPTTREGA